MDGELQQNPVRNQWELQQNPVRTQWELQQEPKGHSNKIQWEPKGNSNATQREPKGNSNTTQREPKHSVWGCSGRRMGEKKVIFVIFTHTLGKISSLCISAWPARVMLPGHSALGCWRLCKELYSPSSRCNKSPPKRGSGISGLRPSAMWGFQPTGTRAELLKAQWV